MGRGHQAPGGEGWAPPDPGLGPEGELHGRRLPASDTNNSGRGRGRRGMWLPAADPQEAPEDCTGLSSLRADKPSFLGKAQVHMPTETPLTVPRRSPAPPRPAQRHRPCEGGSLRRAGPRGCSRGSVQPPAPPHVLSSQDTPTLPRDLGSHGGGLGGAWVFPQPQEAHGRDWPSASLCQGRAPGTPQLPPLPPRASSWEPSTA